MTQGPARRAISVGVGLVAAGIGALTAFGCVIAALFERDGFGRPRDAEPRTWYLALMGLGLALSIAVPVVILARSAGRQVAVIGVVVALGLGALLFGLTS